jgi:predicted small secreted protein
MLHYIHQIHYQYTCAVSRHDQWSMYWLSANKCMRSSLDSCTPVSTVQSTQYTSILFITRCQSCRRQFILIFAFLLFCLVMTASAKRKGVGGGFGEIDVSSASKSVSDSKIGQAIYLTLGAYAIQQMMIHQV